MPKIRTKRLDRAVYDQTYYELNKERYAERARASYAKRREESPMLVRYQRLKLRAESSGIPFDLELDDLPYTEFCPYLGIPLRYIGRLGGDSASVDRIHPDKGYVKGNVEVVSQLANVMKNNATPDQLVQFARTVLERYT